MNTETDNITRIEGIPVPDRVSCFVEQRRVEIPTVTVPKSTGQRSSPEDWYFVELRGIEPLTPSMPWKCSAN